MQNPNEDTEWNDILRSRGIIGPKQTEVEIHHDQLVEMVEQSAAEHIERRLDAMSTNELDELEDQIDYRILQQYREKRMAEMTEMLRRSSFGSVKEVTGSTYVQEVNNAPTNVVVIVLIYRRECTKSQHFLPIYRKMAQELPEIKFCAGLASVCIRNYPDAFTPTILYYRSGSLLRRDVGSSFQSIADFKTHLMRIRLLGPNGLVKPENIKKWKVDDEGNDGSEAEDEDQSDALFDETSMKEDNMLKAVAKVLGKRNPYL
ncbi:hypothetical protein ACOME3_002550 [Neoechinorhynchus agilis]